MNREKENFKTLCIKESLVKFNNIGHYEISVSKFFTTLGIWVHVFTEATEKHSIPFTRQNPCKIAPICLPCFIAKVSQTMGLPH